jgi:hypothetical protein
MRETRLFVSSTKKKRNEENLKYNLEVCIPTKYVGTKKDI